VTIEVRPVTGIGEVRPGDDVAALIAEAAPWLADGDVVVVTSKIVSKSEGRLVELPPGDAAAEAVREATLDAETARVVARRGPMRIVRTHHGFVMAAAGIDASNVDSSMLVLLPEDPDASARRLRTALRDRFGRRVAVIVSDTMGRAWRNGQTDVALGVAGMAAIRDHRGQVDPYGNELQVTEIAVADQLAGAAELVKGKIDRVPVAVVRGLGLRGDEPDGPGVAPLIRDADTDMFGLGTAEARAAGLRAAATLPDPTVPTVADATVPAVADATVPAVAGLVPAGRPATTVAVHQQPAATDPAAAAEALGAVAQAAVAPPDQPGSAAVAAAIAAVAGAVAPDTQLTHRLGVRGHEILARPAGPADPATLIRLGADLHRVRAALAAEGLASTVHEPTADSAGNITVTVTVTTA
jgi:coenzyme F420-0:L-glutamate ligase/coenzyme F420-1:gamma-L-glutamate ligase